MKELYQGMNATLSHMTTEEKIQYKSQVLVNMCRENIRARNHTMEVDDQELFDEVVNQLVKEEAMYAMRKPALKLYRKGMMKKEIAEVLDVDPQMVNAWLAGEKRKPE